MSQLDDKNLWSTLVLFSLVVVLNLEPYTRVCEVCYYTGPQIFRGLKMYTLLYVWGLKIHFVQKIVDVVQVYVVYIC